MSPGYSEFRSGRLLPSIEIAFATNPITAIIEQQRLLLLLPFLLFLPSQMILLASTAIATLGIFQALHRILSVFASENSRSRRLLVTIADSFVSLRSILPFLSFLSRPVLRISRLILFHENGYRIFVIDNSYILILLFLFLLLPISSYPLVILRRTATTITQNREARATDREKIRNPFALKGQKKGKKEKETFVGLRN